MSFLLCRYIFLSLEFILYSMNISVYHYVLEAGFSVEMVFLWSEFFFGGCMVMCGTVFYVMDGSCGVVTAGSKLLVVPGEGAELPCGVM